MTKTIKILTDSSVQLTPTEIEDNNITIIPLSVDIAGKNYIDGETITRAELLEQLKEGFIPKTSQPAIGTFVETFERLGADGSQVLAIMMTDVLSGTYETARTAAQIANADVTVINSKSTDRGQAFQVLAAAQDIKKGKSIPEIIEHCKDVHARTTVDVFVDDLQCLVAGGRVSRFAGAITKLINLKIIVRLSDTALDVYTKGRSRKTFIKHCKELAAEHVDNPIEAISLSNVGTDEALLQKVRSTILDDKIEGIPYVARLTSPVIMAHTGMNAIGVITLAEKPVEN